MTISGTQMLAAARVHLADSTNTTPFWKDSELVHVANLCVNELLPLLPKDQIPSYAGSAVVDTEIGVAGYELSAFTPAVDDLHSIDSIYLDGYHCRPTSHEFIQLIRNNVLLAPARHAPVWWPRDTKIYVAPTPAEAVTSGISLEYRRQPDLLEVDDLDETIAFRLSVLPILGMLIAGRAKTGAESAEQGNELIRGAYQMLSSLIGANFAPPSEEKKKGRSKQ